MHYPGHSEGVKDLCTLHRIKRFLINIYLIEKKEPGSLCFWWWWNTYCDYLPFLLSIACLVCLPGCRLITKQLGGFFILSSLTKR